MTNYRQLMGLPININEFKNAEIVIMRGFQQSSFSKEIHDLNENKYVDKRSQLYNLDPFVDDYGLIRVAGRLENAKISYEKRHQIIIPNAHFITDLIINYYHLTYYHAGTHTILYAIRQKYWIIDGRNQIKKSFENVSRVFVLSHDWLFTKWANCRQRGLTEVDLLITSAWITAVPFI